MTTIPPYGYVKDVKHSEQWIVDNEAAKVVKRIFALCMNGNGPAQIARILKEEQVLPPYCLSRQKGTSCSVRLAGPPMDGTAYS